VPALEAGAQRAPWRTAAAGHHHDSRRPDTHSECSTGNWWSANGASALINGEQTQMLPSRRKVQRIGCAYGSSALCVYPLWWVSSTNPHCQPTTTHSMHDHEGGRRLPGYILTTKFLQHVVQRRQASIRRLSEHKLTTRPDSTSGEARLDPTPSEV
jgi:hypothetical protein